MRTGMFRTLFTIIFPARCPGWCLAIRSCGMNGVRWNEQKEGGRGRQKGRKKEKERKERRKEWRKKGGRGIGRKGSSPSMWSHFCKKIYRRKPLVLRRYLENMSNWYYNFLTLRPKTDNLKQTIIMNITVNHFYRKLLAKSHDFNRFTCV